MSLTKAKLIFAPLRTQKRQVDDQVSVQSGSLGTGNLLNRLSRSVEKAGEALDQVERVMNSVGMDASLARVMDTGLSLSNNYVGSANELTFQFNPSTLRISAYGGGMTPISNYVAQNKSSDKQDNKNGENKSQISYGPIQENITVDFKVIFDATQNTDAFMADKLNLSASGIGKTAGELISQDVYSVRAVVEGFLIAVRNHDRRKVTFQWGSLSYTGSMNSVQSNYTMFNLSGEPIRAEVSIRLLATASEKNNYNYIEEWTGRYNSLMKKAKNGKISTSDSSNLANNLINLQL